MSIFVWYELLCLWLLNTNKNYLGLFVFNKMATLIVFCIFFTRYAIVYKKGYQEFDDVQGAVTSKVKGVVYTNFTHVPGLDGRIWDVADYVIPPQVQMFDVLWLL